MSDCQHNVIERELAVSADGMCPLCMAAEMDRLRASKVELMAALKPFAANVDSLTLFGALGHIGREQLLKARDALAKAGGQT